MAEVTLDTILAELKKHDIRFDRLETRMAEGFAAVDKRFEAVDRRLDAMDLRFDAMDKRLDAMDRRFDAMDKRFDAMDKRLDGMDRKLELIATQTARTVTDVSELGTRVTKPEGPTA